MVHNVRRLEDDMMTATELKKMNRKELIELLLEQTTRREQVEEELSRTRIELTTQIDQLKAQLSDRKICLEESGSIAQAALQLNGIFEVAQRAADDYLSSIKLQEASTKARCDAMVEKAKRESEEYWNKVEQELTKFYDSHEGIKDMLTTFGHMPEIRRPGEGTEDEHAD